MNPVRRFCLFVESNSLFLALSTNADIALAIDDATDIEICSVIGGWAYMVITMEQSSTDSSKHVLSAYVVLESGTSNPTEFSQGKTLYYDLAKTTWSLLSHLTYISLLLEQTLIAVEEVNTSFRAL